MIRIDKISICRFRGIIQLELDLGGENYAICGPNGTGKSGVMDAIEFVLSGDVSRLSGKGRGNVSVKEHAPHVDYRDLPDDAYVELRGEIVATGKKFSVKRSVGKIKEPTISPNIPEVMECLNEFGRHKNVALSRRELIQYILSTPGERAEGIQALLQLDLLASLRQNLYTISNAKKRNHSNKTDALKRAGDSLATAHSIPKLKQKDFLVAVNKRRKLLDLPEIKTLETDTSVKDGLTVTSASSQTAFSKPIALKDLETCKQQFTLLDGDEFQGWVADQLKIVQPLAESSDFDTALDKQDLLRKSIDLIEGDFCPVCDTAWKQPDLISHIKKKQIALEEFVKQKGEIENALVPIRKVVADTASRIQTIVTYGQKLKEKLECKELASLATALESAHAALEKFASAKSVLDALESLSCVSENAMSEYEKLDQAINAIPDSSERDAARDYLVAVQERLSVYRDSKRSDVRALQEKQVAEKIYDAYEKAYTEGLNTIYSDIQENFGDLYSEVNKDDEGDFEASLESTGAQLGLDVEFYGRGKFPPGAYHSEGHQDAMGLCLYLALMSHLYQSKFTFCVLDDVLMSVDGGHRRAVCQLLMKTFPKTQFVFTTHDPVWLNNMYSTGLVKRKNSILFRNWNVDDGPMRWVGKDVWKEIQDQIDNNEIRAAASELRHYLEYLAAQLCHNLGASVVYRGDNRHSLGDLMPQATSRFSKILKDAKSAAKSWSLGEGEIMLDKLIGEFKTAVAETQLEQWAVNAKVHYNEWANLEKNDFKPVVASFQKLIAYFECGKCESLLYVLQNGEHKESLRCACGDKNINLKKK